MFSATTKSKDSMDKPCTQTIKETSQSAERCSRWPWIRRKDLNWAPRRSGHVNTPRSDQPVVGLP